MKEAGKTSERIFGYLLNLNFWIIMTIGSLISGSINGYIREGSAYEFLKEVEAIPRNTRHPQSIPANKSPPIK